MKRWDAADVAALDEAMKGMGPVDLSAVESVRDRIVSEIVGLDASTVRKALIDPGPVPWLHYIECARLRRHWPALWRALMDTLSAEERKHVELYADRAGRR